MRVFNVPASAPFLHTVIAALVDGRLVDGFNARAHPERLAEATLYLPTRRAGRMAREIFLDVLESEAAILPRIVALGDIDEDELAFAQASSLAAEAELAIPPALGGLPRRLMLAQLIAAWAKRLTPRDARDAPLVVGGPASALALADDLARLMDDMTTRGVDWHALDGLVPDDLDKYWQLTLQFLSIARQAWPQYLKETGRIEPAARRDLLIEAETARLMDHRGGPVIAAGSTGSMPATAKFLHAIANLPYGAVVLPGLDIDLDDDAWRSIGGASDSSGGLSSPPVSSHPQFAMQALLTRFGLARPDVETLRSPAPHGREVLTSEAMRPASATAQWHTRLSDPAIAQHIETGMLGVAVIEAANTEMEALAIAVAMREARENNLTAALVTPDRALARRVMAALGRWQLPFDDSAGERLMETSAGLFARLVARTIAEQFAPATLLALLKHPLLRLGAAAGAWRRPIETLEIALFRGTRPAAGSHGLAQDFARFRDELAKCRRGEPSMLHRSEPRAHLADKALDAAGHLIGQLCRTLAPLETAATGDFAQLAAVHRDAIVALSRDADGRVAAFEGFAGETLVAAFDELADHGPTSGLAVSSSDYPDVFEAAFGDRIVRRPQTPDARLRIYGLLEARLTDTDRVILGSLIEGVWPPAPRADPWLSRPMRHQLGLDLPERRIGLTAHDFAQLLGAPEVILTHAAKMGGAPAVASRFLHRLEAIAGPAGWTAAKLRGARYLHYADELDRPHEIRPALQPMPRPPRSLRPMALSVTQIEDWLRDPYTIYARHILKLLPLDPVDMPLSAADRGSAIHNALAEFTTTFGAALPDDPAAELIRIGETHFAPLMDRPEARALWWPRFARIAMWFGGWEISRRSLTVTTIHAETPGKLTIEIGPGRTFVLSARADRIEQRSDGSFAVLDYKTGETRTGRQVRLGLAPQLSLEAAILREGGFPAIGPGGPVSELMYVRLSGNNPPGKAEPLDLTLAKGDTFSPDQVADQARGKLEIHIRRFENENEPYKALSLPMWKNKYGQYDNLARIKEWSATAGAGDEDE